MSEDPTVRKCYPVTGDWFLVSETMDHKWFIERVILWALLPARPGDQQVESIDPQGRLGSSLERLNYFFAYGPDPSPANNRTWKEVYDQTQSDYLNVREITQLLKDCWKSSKYWQGTS